MILRALPLVLLVLAACAPVSRLPEVDPRLAAEEADLQREIAIETQQKRAARLNGVAFRVLAANAELCPGRQRRLAGYLLTSAESHAPDDRPVFAKLYGAGGQPMVASVVPGGPAAQAGLQRGDQLLALGGRPLKPGRDGLQQMFEVSRRLDDKEPWRLTVARQGAPREVTVNPPLGCDYPAQVVRQDAVNAFADGNRVNITTGMMRFAETEDELALVFGHELAHNTMGHVPKKQGNSMIGVILGTAIGVVTGIDLSGPMGDATGNAFSQEFEAEADYVGVYYAARAGFDVQGAAHLWRRMAAEHPQSINLGGSTHPSTAKRFLAIDTAAREVADKRAKGAPLTPDVKEGGK